MKNKFKVGDRIIVYSGNDILKGTIRKIDGDTILLEGFLSFYHIKQCRKLKRKEPKVYWVDKDRLCEVSEYNTPKQDCFVKVKIIK